MLHEWHRPIEANGRAAKNGLAIARLRTYIIRRKSECANR
jgi:hypothetical protein